jgi:hypothetical protein
LQPGPRESLAGIHFATDFNLTWIVERASGITLPVSDPFDTPSNRRSTDWTEFVIYLLAALADAREDFGGPFKHLHSVVIDR